MNSLLPVDKPATRESLPPSAIVPDVTIAPVFPPALFPTTAATWRPPPTAAYPFIAVAAVGPITVHPDITGPRSRTISFNSDRRGRSPRIDPDVSRPAATSRCKNSGHHTDKDPTLHKCLPPIRGWAPEAGSVLDSSA